MKKILVVLLANAVVLVAVLCGVASPGLADTQSDQDYYNAGVAYQEKGEWENAITAFHSMVTRGSLAGDVSLRSADCYVKINMPRAALAELRTGLPEVGTDIKSARLIVAKLAEYTKLAKRFGPKRFDDLIAAYRCLAIVDGDNASEYAQAIIDCYLDKSDWDGANSACDFVINNYPGTKAAKLAALKKGSVYEGKSDWSNAIDAYLACGKQFPDMIGESALKASNCYEKTNDLIGGVRMLKQCIKSTTTDPKLAELYERLGDECFRLEADTEATAALAKGLDAPETDRVVTSRVAGKLAKYYVKTGDRGQAAAVYTKLITLHPDRALNYQVELARALISYDLTASDQIALEASRNAGSVVDAGTSVVWHANDLVGCGKTEAAVDFMTRAVSELPETAKYVISARAIIRDRFRIQTSEIANDYRQLIGTYPDCESVPEWKLRMAESQFLWLKDYESAKKTLSEIVSNYPKWPQMIAAKHDLGMVYRATGDYKDALATFDEALACPEYGNYRALILAQKASCYRDLGQKGDQSGVVDSMSNAYPDDCWTALEESRQGGATASGE